MKNKFIQLLILILLFFTTQAFANPINKINFIGLNTSSESSLLEILPFKIGQDFSPYVSDKIIESLFQTGLFSNIIILKNKSSLDIKVTENPLIKFFDISLDIGSGISKWLKNEKIYLSQEVLNEHLNESNLSIGNVYTKIKLTEFISLLENKYAESGYYNVEIIENIVLDSQNRIAIDLVITQGERATIDSFEISGNDKFQGKELLKLFKIGV